MIDRDKYEENRVASNFAEIKCGKCRNKIPIDFSDLDVQEIGDGDEREMGPELTYFGFVDVSCPQCRHTMTVDYTATEYPVGSPADSETRVDGGELITGFGDIDVQWDERLYEFSDQAGLYVPKQQEIITRLGNCSNTLILEAHHNPDVLYSADPRAFEEMVAYIFKKHGFEVELTKKSKDGGRDIIACRNDDLGTPLKYLVECKRYAKDRPVSVEMVRALYGVHQKEGANKSMLVTTSRFTRGARDFVQGENTTEIQMRLVEFAELRRWIANTFNR
ncbi:hypothetical protein GFK26_18205 [Variovorax paradoxus]|uniref:Restriction endonuclease type IV Mrr domain-containing protein n=1 Tax=Variovorax paradoxus TaxID=34073 RepID=A0A5Q0M846_VARPD|nr:restriction endonuclease [Variovorax paradoxus]QFZ84562.1 hypothetical protein GFK26_18205 [Variovorax paradoxus]